MRNFGLVAAAGMLLIGPPVGITAPEPIVINDNRSPAGTLRNGVLTIQLEVRSGDWRVDGDSNPGLEVLAFAEEGRALQVPGPMIRVPEGTEIHATVRNPLSTGTLTCTASTHEATQAPRTRFSFRRAKYERSDSQLDNGERTTTGLRPDKFCPTWGVKVATASCRAR